MTLSEIAKYRLSNQQLNRTKFKSPVELIEWFAAIQSQEYAQTKWSIGLRLPHVTDADVENEFTSGKILRTHLLRPTWHFVSNNDIRWLLALTAPRVHASNAFMYRNLELDEKVFNPAIEILIKILEGNRELTREEINNEFQKNGIIASGHRLSYIMMYTELEGIICSGSRKGNQFTYALLEERVTPQATPDTEEALSRLTLKYFASRAPATIKDFATWSGLTLTQCKKGIEINKTLLSQGICKGETYYFLRDRLQEEEDNFVHLLSIYDEYIMGYKDRSAYFEFKKSLKTASGLRYDCMIVYAGQTIGTWRRVVKQKSITIEANFFKPSNKTQNKAVDNALNRFEEFNGLTVNFRLPFS